MIGGLGSEPIRGGESLIELAEVAEVGERCELVDYHVGLSLSDRLDDGIAIQSVEDYGYGASGAQRICLARHPRAADHCVAVGDQLRDQPLAQYSGRSCDEYLHVILLR